MLMNAEGLDSHMLKHLDVGGYNVSSPVIPIYCSQVAMLLDVG